MLDGQRNGRRGRWRIGERSRHPHIIGIPAAPTSALKAALTPVLFNYRYNPVHWKVEEVISSGRIGNVKSVHFEWLLVSLP